ncbi:aldehyde dehydrogenase family protein [Streptomyces gamaensis]|uniref:Aldehyde dehydrogenase family protein n=1 Tax=Streptomyces gamaensis TaxID=1763542 RepID=A0ABW0YZJ7_9ACTN
MDERFLMRIGGRAVPAHDGAVLHSFEPATRRRLAELPSGGPEDVRRAVAAARHAFDEGPWPRMPAAERAALLRAVARRVDAASESLARWEARDNGATLRKALGADVPGAAAAFEWSAWWAEQLPERQPAAGDGAPGPYAVWRPVGVVAAIVPWNLPLLLAAWRIAPAIAAGNTCVVKPASFASLSVLELVRLLHECGLPPGVVNVVTGPGAGTGEALVRSPGVDLVSFTGSDGTGAAVRQGADAAGTPARLDLGGKSPQLVLADADVQRAVTGVAWGAFLHNGQVCMAGSRAVVHRDVHEEFLGLLAERVGRLRVGDPLDPATDLGPLVSRSQARTARRFTALGLSQGARLVCGGRAPGGGELPDGLDPAAYHLPTVLASVRPDDAVAQEEIFGPVLSVIRADSDEDAVRIANGTRYGLSAGVWSADPGHARAVAEELRADRVWINDYRIVDLERPDPRRPQDAVWTRLTNELDAYRRRHAVIVTEHTDGAAGAGGSRLLPPTPYALLGS